MALGLSPVGRRPSPRGGAHHYGKGRASGYARTTVPLAGIDEPGDGRQLRKRELGCGEAGPHFQVACLIFPADDALSCSWKRFNSRWLDEESFAYRSVCPFGRFCKGLARPKLL